MCDHSYKVYTAAIDPACLLVRCDKCKESGRVLDFKPDEWKRATWREPFVIEKERVETEEDYLGFNFRSEF